MGADLIEQPRTTAPLLVLEVIRSLLYPCSTRFQILIVEVELNVAANKIKRDGEFKARG
jgi:hypothetical protein